MESNSRPRFGIEGGQIFDYETSRYMPARGIHTAKNGLKFDLGKVAAALRENRFIEEAIVGFDEQGTELAQENEALKAKNEELTTKLADSERAVGELNAQLQERITALESKAGAQTGGETDAGAEQGGEEEPNGNPEGTQQEPSGNPSGSETKPKKGAQGKKPAK